ncbi:arf-GAP with dual PH domain-containing protein 2 isoform X2 [Lates japonicus]|uniref:Arf-GAP with dual PH domain-containing protein 2 isoform X2 n=1 Tax=Lates japonicus TaxID=270547 RepID=A0AAD3RDT5_LATJO|nr:arf-GAP with dual PH domain-containing protein 2 isoform X2 [Lates japonicus]
MLWKKGKENTQFLKRKFVLSEREFTLTYYNKENEIVTWYNAIRAAHYAYLKTAATRLGDEEEREQKEWLDVLRQVLSRPVAP